MLSRTCSKLSSSRCNLFLLRGHIGSKPRHVAGDAAAADGSQQYSSVGEQELQAAVSAVWPADSTDPEARVKHEIARFLLTQQDSTALQSLVASAAKQLLGTFEALGIGGRFQQLLQRDTTGCFVLLASGPQGGTEKVRLDTVALQKYAKQLSSLYAGIQPQLLGAVQAVWPADSTDPDVQVKHYTACFLSQCANSTSPLQPVSSRVANILGGIKSLGISSSYKKLLLRDATGCFVFTDDGGADGNSEVLRLDGAALLQYAKQHSGGSSFPDSSSSSRAAGSSSSSSTTAKSQLLQVVEKLWPRNSKDAAVRVKHAAAVVLLQYANFAASGGAMGQIGQQLGSNKALGIPRFSAVLLGDPSGCFIHTPVEKSLPNGRWQLDAVALLRYAKTKGITETPTTTTSSSSSVVDSNAAVSSSDGGGGSKNAGGGEKQQLLQLQQMFETLKDRLVKLESSHNSRSSQTSHGDKLGEQEDAASSAVGTSAALDDDNDVGVGDQHQQQQMVPRVTQLKFELQLNSGNGWVQPLYVVAPQQQQQTRPRLFGLQQQQQQQQQENVSAFLGSPQQLVDVMGSKAVLQSLPASASSSGVGDAAVTPLAADSAGNIDWDEGGHNPQVPSALAAAVHAAASADEEAGVEAGAGEQQQEHQQEPDPGAEAGEQEQLLNSGSDYRLDEEVLPDNISSYDSGLPAEGVDAAVWSIAKLLPDRVRADLQPYTSLDASPALEEVLIDKNQQVVLRLSNRSMRILPYSVDLVEALSLLETAQQQWQLQGRVASFDEESQLQQQYLPDISYASQSAAYRHARDFSGMFRSDGRMGVPGTLHRISVLRNRDNTPVGLTYRLGRHVPEKANLIGDVLSSMKASIMPGTPAARAQSLLVLGKPGTGKTTLLRDIARILSTPPEQGGLGLAVLIVDTSNEIAGDADECHPCIGYARRLMVPHRDQQADILVQAVQNHNPDVIIVDEIGTKQEVEAARTIAERGVVLIGTAHGSNLSTLMRNPVLRPLVGGVSAVTLGDEMAKNYNSNVKTRLERAGAATFVSLLELDSRDAWRLHLDVEQSVDLLLGQPSEVTAALDPASKLTGAAAAAAAAPVTGTLNRSDSRVSVNTQVRSKDADGRLWVQFETAAAAEQTQAAAKVVEQLAAGSNTLC